MEACQVFSIHGDHQFVAGFVVYGYVNEAKHVNKDLPIDCSNDYCCSDQLESLSSFGHCAHFTFDDLLLL